MPAITQRQIEVAEGIRAGLSYGDIGLQLGISEHTVRVHAKALSLILHCPSEYPPRVGLLFVLGCAEEVDPSGLWADRWADGGERYRLRYAAHRAVRTAVENGTLVKPRYCPECGGAPPAEQMHAHHDDYSKPLDIKWKCAACHVAFHHLHQSRGQ